MCVAWHLQGSGYGPRLLLAFEEPLFAEGFKSVFLETGEAVRARKFYERLGYKNLSLVSLSKRPDALLQIQASGRLTP